MPQVISIVSQSAVIAEELDLMFDDFSRDGEISIEELRALSQKVDQNKSISIEAELAYQWGMAVMKGGINGKRAKEIELENTRFEIQRAQVA